MASKLQSHQVFTSAGDHVATLQAEGNPSALVWASPTGPRTFALISGRYLEVDAVPATPAPPHQDR